MLQNDPEELQYCIALTMVPAIGPVIARRLIEKTGSARAVFREDREDLEKIEGIGPRLSASIRSSSLFEQAGKELNFLERHRIDALYFRDPGYPRRLKECHDAPILLYAKGSQGMDPGPCLSVVGTRRASSYGTLLCRELVEGLAGMLPGLTIVSGLAYGIDAIAHRAALEFGLPTVAVLGHGLDTLYPSSHRDLAKRIIAGGALVTDFHSGMGPERNNFLRRNRIIAGMADATLVVESAEQGGALITAGMAHSYGRDVLAVPGRRIDERSRGCNRLITNQVAALIESPADVIRHLNWKVSGESMIREFPILKMDPREKQILDLISQEPGITPDALGRLSGIPVHRIMVYLLEMEIRNWVYSEPGNRYISRICAGP
jgi:DNA processing protein